MEAFVGPGTPLSADGLTEFSNVTGAGEHELWAVVSVETSGCGFLPDRRPKILFERHKFSALTGGKFDASHPDISQPTAGGYGESGANQYNRLGEALLLDETAALQSASWGLGQIMGQNFRAAGFGSVQEMVTAIIESEDKQLLAMARFLKTSLLAQSLAQRDWPSFARGYNGANYAANNYDGKLGHFYSLFSTGNAPDVKVRTVQMLLIYKGQNPGQIDGRSGGKTTEAICTFQSANDMQPTGVIDDALLAALMKP